MELHYSMLIHPSAIRIVRHMMIDMADTFDRRLLPKLQAALHRCNHLYHNERIHHYFYLYTNLLQAIPDLQRIHIRMYNYHNLLSEMLVLLEWEQLEQLV
jgi:hypothetical protein